MILEEVDGSGAVVATMTLPVASIPHLPDALVTVEAALVNGQGRRFRLRFDAIDATSAVPSESLERFPGMGFSGLAKQAALAITVDVAARKVYAATAGAPPTLQVFPNPATEQCVVIVPGVTADNAAATGTTTAMHRQRLRVLTSRGETIHDDDVQPASVVTFDVSRLAVGVYSVVLDAADGTRQTATVLVVR